MEWWKKTQPKRLSLLLFGVVVWLTGYWFFPDGWWHRHMLQFMVLLPLVLNFDSVLPTLRHNILLWLVTLSATYYALMTQEWPSVLPLLGLLLALATAAHTAGRRMGFLLLGYLVIGIVTTIWSLIEFYLMREHPHFLLVRFHNTLVYKNGLHPVLSGMLCGLSLIAGLSCKKPSHTASKWLTYIGMAALSFAMLAANTRGALLATGCAGIVLLCWKKKDILWLPGMIGVALYLLVATTRAPISPDNPLLKDQSTPRHFNIVSRGTTGRADIYKVYLDSIQPADIWLGKGSLKQLFTNEVGWTADHPHSSFFTVFWQTGIVGSGLLLVTLVSAIRRGIQCWQHSHLAKAWLSLLVFGIAALIFDGGQIYILNSSARIEPFFLLVPIILLGSLKRKQSAQQ